MDLRERAGHAGAANDRRHPWELARARFFRRLLRDHADLAAAGRVLDVGAGDGWFAHELAPDLGPATEIVCWDVNYRSEDLTTPPGERIVRTASSPEGLFDVVLLLDVIEHVEHDETSWPTRWCRSLAPGGTAVVSVPAYPRLFSDHDRMLEHHRRYRPPRSPRRSSPATCGSWPPAACSPPCWRPGRSACCSSAPGVTRTRRGGRVVRRSGAHHRGDGGARCRHGHGDRPGSPGSPPARPLHLGGVRAMIPSSSPSSPSSPSDADR